MNDAIRQQRTNKKNLSEMEGKELQKNENCVQGVSNFMFT